MTTEVEQIFALLAGLLVAMAALLFLAASMERWMLRPARHRAVAGSRPPLHPERSVAPPAEG